MDYSGAEVYDSLAKSWSDSFNVPTNTGEGECGVQYLDSFVVFGGSNSRLVQQYNFTTGQWTNPFTLNNGIAFSRC
jgi:hypothetical protein